MGTRILFPLVWAVALGLTGCGTTPSQLPKVQLCFFPQPAISLCNGDNLTGWRSPTGDWRVVGAVQLDLANQKHFTTRAGHGVLINSATNHTVNLLSTAEFGDCEAHIEFCVPHPIPYCTFITESYG